MPTIPSVLHKEIYLFTTKYLNLKLTKTKSNEKWKIALHKSSEPACFLFFLWLSSRSRLCPLPHAWPQKRAQGAKGQEGELFGIQNLLKFSDDSLLKALRMKHDALRDASRATSTAEEGGGGGGGAVGGVDVGAVAATNKTIKKANNLGMGIDVADQAELVLAMKGVLERATDGTKPGKLCLVLFLENTGLLFSQEYETGRDTP